MRIEQSVTSISWIPSEAIAGMARLPFSFGTFHYDQAPPDDLGPSITDTLETLRVQDRFRFANHLAAWIAVDDNGAISEFGYGGGGRIGATRVKMGPTAWFVGATALPDRRGDPVLGDGFVRFTQTAGGRTGVPAPRSVRHPPFVQYRAPIAWTTLSLTLRADGTSEFEVTGASPFPRHWIYDNTGRLSAKSGTTEFKEWWKHAFGKHTPWGALDSPALITAVETELERELSNAIMRGTAKPEIRHLKKGVTLIEQGGEGEELYLLLDGVLSVEVDGNLLVELGPGAVLGERAVIESGRRTSTVRAVTTCRVAAVPGSAIDRDALGALSAEHHREQA